MALFIAAFIPGFVDPSRGNTTGQFLTYALTFQAIGLVVDLLVGIGAMSSWWASVLGGERGSDARGFSYIEQIPNAPFDNISFGRVEEARAGKNRVHLVAAATSFHWVPPQVGLDRVAGVLRPGGSVALWWNHFGPVEHVLIPWTAAQTAEQVRLFLGSFSHWMTLEDVVRNNLLDAIEGLVDDAFGGIVHRPFLTAVYTAQPL